MSDSTTRELERLVVAGDETLCAELEREYLRAGPEPLDALQERLERHVGRDIFPCQRCRNCIDGRGDMGDGGTFQEMSEGLSRDVPCPECAGVGFTGPLKFTRGLLKTDYTLLRDPAYRGYAEVQNRLAFVESVSVNRERRDNPRGIRAHVMIVSRATLFIASAAADDWTGHQLLAKWLHRPGVMNRKITTTDLAALRRLGGTAEPGPLVALWCGAAEPYRCGCGTLGCAAQSSASCKSRPANQSVQDPEQLARAIDAMALPELEEQDALQRLAADARRRP